MPRQHLLDPDDLNADCAPAGPDEPSRWPKDTFAPNPQSLGRFTYVLSNPLRYTDPTGYGCPGFLDDMCDAAGEAAHAVGDVALKGVDALGTAGKYMRDTAAGCAACWKAELALTFAELRVIVACSSGDAYACGVAWGMYVIAEEKYREVCLGQEGMNIP
jgi:hypothetical protein